MWWTEAEQGLLLCGISKFSSKKLLKIKTQGAQKNDKWIIKINRINKKSKTKQIKLRAKRQMHEKFCSIYRVVAGAQHLQTLVIRKSISISLFVVFLCVCVCFSGAGVFLGPHSFAHSVFKGDFWENLEFFLCP